MAGQHRNLGENMPHSSIYAQQDLSEIELVSFDEKPSAGRYRVQGSAVPVRRALCRVIPLLKKSCSCAFFCLKCVPCHHESRRQAWSRTVLIYSSSRAALSKGHSRTIPIHRIERQRERRGEREKLLGRVKTMSLNNFFQSFNSVT